MPYRLPVSLLICVAVLAACDKSSVSADEVAQRMQADQTDENHEISWIHAAELDTPGMFEVIADRIATSDPNDTETVICQASATASTSSWTCQTVRPSVMVQAAEKLKAEYEDRGIEVGEYNLARTGEGAGFAGYFILAAPDDGPVARIPCRGSQDGLDFKLDCDFSFAEDDAAEPAQPIPGETT